MSWCKLYYIRNSIKLLNSQQVTLKFCTAASTHYEEPQGWDIPTGKRIGITETEQYQLLDQAPASPGNSEILKISLLGAPNAGKSTIINTLMSWKVSHSCLFYNIVVFSSVSVVKILCEHVSATLVPGYLKINFLSWPKN